MTSLVKFDWSRTTIPTMLACITEAGPDLEAVSQRGRKLTYAELLAKVYGFGNALIDLGVQPGDRVGIWLPNYVEWIVANVAIAAAGAITVPINTLFKAREAEFVLRSARVSVLITTLSFMTNRYI